MVIEEFDQTRETVIGPNVLSHPISKIDLDRVIAYINIALGYHRGFNNPTTLVLNVDEIRELGDDAIASIQQKTGLTVKSSPMVKADGFDLAQPRE